MKISILSMALGITLLSGCSHQALLPTDIQIGPKNALPNGLTVHDFKLDNGMRVLIVPNDEAPVFNMQIWVKTGSLHEVLDPKLRRAGLAHLFEHMMFRGTEDNPGKAYDEKMSQAGQTGLNATTWYDRTNYFLSLPSEQLELGLELEADRFMNLALDKKMFKNEVGAVLGELKMNKDRPGSVASKKLWSTVFRRHPYGKEVIGTQKDLNAFTIDEANYFYKTYYVPNNTTLILVGDVSVARSLSLINRYFGKMKNKAVPKYRVPEEYKQTKRRRKVLTHPSAKNHSLRIGYKIPKDNHVDTASLLVLSSVLGDGDGSLLQRSLVDGGLASSVGVYSTAIKESGMFTISVQMRRKVTESQILRKVGAALNRARTGKLTQRELVRARNTLLLYSYYRINSNSGIGGALADGLLTSNNYMRFFDLVTQTKNVSLHDLQRVAAYYIQPSKSTIIHMKPETTNAKK